MPPPSPTLTVQGVEVPRLGLGTYKLTGSTCRRAVADALALGYRHVDTAEMYGNEAEVGAGLRDGGVPRADVFLTTKVWRSHLRAADVHRAADASLRALGTHYVDLLLVHWPDSAVPLEETLGAFQEVQRAGKTRLIGVSNFPAGLLAQALEVAPELACDQVEYHVLLGQQRLLGLTAERGLFLTAYAPVARMQVAHERVVQEIAATHGVSTAEVALAWLLAQDGVAAVPKASTRDHLELNLRALRLDLSEAERAALDLLPKDRRMVDSAWVDWER